MSAIQHEKFIHLIHEYERVKGSKEVYKCMHPKCNHFIRREYLINREAICHKCKNPFVLTWPQLRNKYPVCEFCTRSPKSEMLRAARDTAFSALNDFPDELKQALIDKTLE